MIDSQPVYLPVGLRTQSRGNFSSSVSTLVSWYSHQQDYRARAASSPTIPRVSLLRDIRYDRLTDISCRYRCRSSRPTRCAAGSPVLASMADACVPVHLRRFVYKLSRVYSLPEPARTSQPPFGVLRMPQRLPNSRFLSFFEISSSFSCSFL